MRTETALAPKRLAEYTPPAFLADTVHLTFRLSPGATEVTARIAFRPNPEAEPGQALKLDGERMELLSASVD
ncbi:MAG: hypothetical protein ACPGID_11785, partial [Rubricella sp.]